MHGDINAFSLMYGLKPSKQGLPGLSSNYFHDVKMSWLLLSIIGQGYDACAGTAIMTCSQYVNGNDGWKDTKKTKASYTDPVRLPAVDMINQFVDFAKKYAGEYADTQGFGAAITDGFYQPCYVPAETITAMKPHPKEDRLGVSIKSKKKDNFIAGGFYTS